MGVAKRVKRGFATVRRDLLRMPVQPLPPLRRPAALRWSPHAFTLALSLVLLVAQTQLTDEYQVGGGLAACLTGAQTAAVALALHRPMLAWWVSLTTFVVSAEAVFPPPDTGSLWPWTIAGLFAHAAVQLLLSLRVPARVSAETVGAALALTALLEAQGGGHDYSRSFAFAVLLFAVTGVLGAALRGRREANRQLAAQESVTAEERARRALLEERSRIARELHDVVAHHMSVISVQAEAAPYRVPDPPEELTRSFAVIRENAVEALDELRRVLGVLRSGDVEAETGETSASGRIEAPQPALDRLDDLLSNVRRSGLEVRAEVTGRRRTLAQGVELSLYRMVQEALSNALRHAPGASVLVRLVYGPSGVDLSVVNTAPAGPVPASPGSGHGLVGMRERAVMLGGSLTAGPTVDGGFEIAVHLPYSDRTLEGAAE